MLKIQLKDAGLTKKKLAENLGVSQNCVTNWGDNPPKYATAYLLEFTKNRELKQSAAWLRKFLEH